MKSLSCPVVCSIGSVDPTGAAGLTMDLRVFAELKALGVAVIAGVTAQNAARVFSVRAIAPTLVAQQLRAIWEQFTPNAVCIGLIPSAAVIAAVERFLRHCRPRPSIVVDPVIRASSGTRFLSRSGVRAVHRLLAIATVATPNLSEAAELTGVRVVSPAQAEAAARMLATAGGAVLVTGGHLAGPACVDVLAHRGRVRRFSSARIKGSMRGAGGILAAALAVELGRGASLEGAVARARRFVRQAYRSARPLGSGGAQFLK